MRESLVKVEEVSKAGEELNMGKVKLHGGMPLCGTTVNDTLLLGYHHLPCLEHMAAVMCHQ